MCSPLPLRVWCMAAMAPALTEAATQAAHIKLPPPSPPASTDSAELNGRDVGQKDPTCPQGRSHLDKGLAKPAALSGLTSYLHNGGLTKQVGGGGSSNNNNSSISPGSFVNLGLARHPPEFLKQDRIASLPRASALGQTVSDRSMNHPTTTFSGTRLIPPTLNSGVLHPGMASIQQSASFVNAKRQGNVNGSSRVNIQSKVALQKANNDADSCSNEAIVVGTGRRAPDCPGVLHGSSTSESVIEMQFNLERKSHLLMKRLRRLQGKQLESHIKNQLSGFVDKQHKNLQTMAKSIKSPNNSSVPVTSADLKTELLQSEDVRSLSTAALVNLVRKLQSSQALTLGHRLLQNVTKADSSSVLRLDKSTCEESDRVACQLRTSLRHVESALDSDATESSSGGESCDEYEQDPEKEKKNQQMPLHRRAEWKWAAERSAIASRWTWLQAQVSDLEYRIRQQSDIHRQIRNSKGGVALGDMLQPEDLMVRLCHSRTGKVISSLDNKLGNGEKKNEMSPANISTLLMNVDRQASKLTQSLGNCISPGQSSPVTSGKSGGQTSMQKSLNGLIDTNHTSGDAEGCAGQGVTNKKLDSLVSLETPRSSPPALDITCQAARCRPVKSYRKRKLLRTAGLHQTSRKAARLSTVKCQCYPPTVPCAMCGGRYNSLQTLESDVMPLHERVSLLDPAFHPVLSFPQEIPLPVHFEALLKSGEWQNKPPCKPAKSAAAERRRQKLLLQQNDTARRTSKKLKNAAAVLLSSAKIRSRYEKKTVQKPRPASLPSTPRASVVGVDSRLCRTDIKKRRAAQLAIAALKKRPGRSLALPSGRLGSGRRFSTSHMPFLYPQTKEGNPFNVNCCSTTIKEIKEGTLRKRRGESAFDINNIVIPYSMAASTRVEKLQYKEIVTPKWRDITLDDSTKDSSSEQDPVPESSVSEVAAELQNKAEAVMEKTGCMDSAEKDEEKVADEEEEEIEDLSDELYSMRHAKCEAQEKKRFVSFIQHSRRGHRTVRPDGSKLVTDPASPEPAPSATTLDTNTLIMPPTLSLTHTYLQSFHHQPQTTASLRPASPQTPPLHPASAPPVSSHPAVATPLVQRSTEEPIMRRRSSSMSKPDRLIFFGEENFTITHETFERVVDPWSPRTFPLNESEYEAMYAEQPPVEVRREPSTSELCRTEIETPNNSHPCSPLPSSSSASIIEDDPNDPEWTIVNGAERQVSKPGLVIRLAKR